MKKIFKNTFFYLKILRLRKEFPNDADFGAEVSQLITKYKTLL
mgnify:CR=1 FL=1|jgi:hypothetical protein